MGTGAALVELGKGDLLAPVESHTSSHADRAEPSKRPLYKGFASTRRTCAA